MSVITRIAAGAAVAAFGCAAVGVSPPAAHAGPHDVARLAGSPCAYLTNQQPFASPGVPWYMNTTAMRQAQRLETGAGVKIGVLDSGVNTTNNQLAGVVKGGGDFTGTNASGNGLTDTFGHGTGVAGIIAAKRAGGTGVVGVAPGATIYSYRTNVGESSGVVNLTAAVEQATADGMRIINISQTIDQPKPSEAGYQQLEQQIGQLKSAVESAISHGILVVAAAGNNFESSNPVEYPAAFPGVLAVGAATPTGTVLGFSGQQSYVDVLGPGSSIDVVLPNNGASSGDSQQDSGNGYVYCTDAGTSFATPYVSGVAALMLQADPQLTPQLITTVMEYTAANEAQWRPGSGWGMVNPYGAVQYALQLKQSPGTASEFRELGQELAARAASTKTGAQRPPTVPAHLPAKLSAAERAQHDGAWIALAAVTILAALILGAAAVVRDQRRRAAAHHKN